MAETCVGLHCHNSYYQAENGQFIRDGMGVIRRQYGTVLLAISVIIGLKVWQVYVTFTRVR